MPVIPISSIVQDEALWPRANLDQQNINHLNAALEAGEVLPPIIVDEISKKLVEGHHRLTVHRRRDPDGSVEVEFRSYTSPQELFLAAVQFNSAHGQPLSSYDKAHCLQIADALSIDRTRIADALAITLERADKIWDSRRAVAPDGSSLMIKRSLRHLAGKQLSQRQTVANERSNGFKLPFLVHQIENLVDNDAIDWTDQTNTDAVQLLKALAAKL